VCIAVAAASVGMWVTPVDVYVKEAELSIYPHGIHSQLERFHPLGGRFSLKTAEEIPVQNYVVIIEKVDSLADNKELMSHCSNDSEIVSYRNVPSHVNPFGVHASRARNSLLFGFLPQIRELLSLLGEHNFCYHQ